MCASKEEALKYFDENVTLLKKPLIQFLINYGRKDLSLSPVDHPKYVIRNSIIYRFNSIRFHLCLLYDIYESTFKQWKENFYQNKTKEFVQISFGKDQMQYVFDDLIFHTISLMDYLGNLIGLIYKNNMNLKWPGVCRSAYAKDNSLSGFQIAPIIIRHNKDWVEHLYDYRSSLIHYKKDDVPGRTSLKFENFNKQPEINFELFVDAPYSFQKIVKSFNNEFKNEYVSLIDATNWIIKKVISCICEIIECFEKEMGPIINKRMEEIYNYYKSK